MISNARGNVRSACDIPLEEDRNVWYHSGRAYDSGAYCYEEHG